MYCNGRAAAGRLTACRGWLAILFCAAALLGGCADGYKPNVNENHQLEQEETEGMGKGKLTKEQEDLLAAISVNESKVHNGELYGWQKEVIRQYEVALEYLRQKYPAHKFLIDWCEPSEAGRKYSIFQFKADQENENYTLYVDIISTEKEKQYECRDNFYGSLIRENYENSLLQLLSDKIPEHIEISCKFSSVYGKECDGTLTFKQIVQEQRKISNTTTINVMSDNGDPERIFCEIQRCIKENRIYGGYIINVYLETMNTECVLSRDFQQFD